MKIGLVTVTFNSELVLFDFLQSVNKQDYTDYRLYVVDNDSSDKTSDILDKDPSLKVIYNKTNVGVAKANNQGIKLALDDGCDLILLVNNDTIFESKLLTKLIHAYQKGSASIVVPKMKYHDSKKIWFAGGFFNPKKAFLNYHIGQGDEDNNQFADRLIDYAPICCSLVHKKVFEEIGFFDEKYFVYFDDADFFYRLKKDGRFKTLYINDVEFYHKIGSLSKSRTSKNSNKYSPFFIKQMTRNHVYFLRKQKSIFFDFLLVYLLAYFLLRFFISSNFSKDLKTFKLIISSYFSGFKIKL